VALTQYQKAALAVAIGSALWGLFWIPLRYLEQAGLPSLLAVAMVMFIALIGSVFFCIRNRTLSELANPTAWIVGSGMGLAGVLYFYGVMTSDVIRVIFLFYLLPVWTTIASRLIYGEPIGRSRLIVIGMALAGLWLLLGGGNRLPLPQNAGDWAGLAAGICWGISLALLKGRVWASPSINCMCCFASGTLIALAASIFIVAEPYAQIPSLLSNLSVLLIVVFFGAFILLPSMIIQIWGAGILPAPTSALLTMTEIISAIISAYLIIGTELEGASALGALIILIAVLSDITLQRYKTNQA
jgi:drug/metabolite transporter (DMT)-like permease